MNAINTQKRTRITIVTIFTVALCVLITACEEKGKPKPTPTLPTKGIAATLSSWQNFEQSAGISGTLISPIYVRVVDQYGDAVGGAQVSFTVTEGSVSPTKEATSIIGVASTRWTLGSTAGTQILTVTAFEADGRTHLAGSPLSLTAIATEKRVATTLSSWVFIKQSAEISTTLISPVYVQVVDQYGDAVGGAQVSFTVTEGSVSPTKEATSILGIASTRWTLGPTVGPKH